MTGDGDAGERLWYDDEVGVYRFEYDPSDVDEFVVELVVALAAVTGVDPLEVDPLAPAVDTERLEACVAALNGDRPRVEGTVTFDAAGCEVTVLAGQVVIVAPEDADRGAGHPDDGVERNAE